MRRNSGSMQFIKPFLVEQDNSLYEEKLPNISSSQ